MFWIVLGLSWGDGHGLLTDSKGNIVSKEEQTDDRHRTKYMVLFAAIVICVFMITIAVSLNFPRTGVIDREGVGVYRGQLKGVNTFHGYGIWFMENGSVCEVEFRNGYFSGLGNIKYPNGSQFIGYFKEGYYHGEGELIFPDGSVQKGFWDMGSLIEK